MTLKCYKLNLRDWLFTSKKRQKAIYFVFSFVQGEFLSLCVKENAHAACNLRDAFLVSSRPQSPDVPINIGDQKNAILHWKNLKFTKFDNSEIQSCSKLSKPNLSMILILNEFCMWKCLWILNENEKISF